MSERTTVLVIEETTEVGVTIVEVTPIGTVPIGPQGPPGRVQSIVAGTNVTVDDTDPANPVVSASGGGGGGVDSVQAGAGIEVDSVDPTAPVVSVDDDHFGTAAFADTGAFAASNDPRLDRVPDPEGQADGRMLAVDADALVFVDAPSGGGIPQGGPLTENLETGYFSLSHAAGNDHRMFLGPFAGLSIGVVGYFEDAPSKGLLMEPVEGGYQWGVVDLADPVVSRIGELPVAQSLSTGAPVIRAFATITQTDYDALDPADSNVLYVVREDTP